MRTQWKTEHCPFPPKEITPDKNGLYIIRKDIQEEYHEAIEDMPAYTDWVCQMAVVEADEAIAYLITSKEDTENRIATNEADIAYIAMMADIEL